MRGTDIAKKAKKRRIPASPAQTYAPPDQYPADNKIWTQEQISSYLLGKYGTLNPDHKLKVRENA